jgi:hypothetical protein
MTRVFGHESAAAMGDGDSFELRRNAIRRRGNCYVTCEALYHLLGGKAAGYVPHTVRHQGEVHWYLVKYALPSGYGTGGGQVIDPTVSQFRTKPDYSKGRGRGFLTARPSKRARALMETMLWQSSKT